MARIKERMLCVPGTTCTVKKACIYNRLPDPEVTCGKDYIQEIKHRKTYKQ